MNLDLPSVNIVDAAFGHNEYTTCKHICTKFRWDRSSVTEKDEVVFYTNHSIKKVNYSLLFHHIKGKHMVMN